MRRHFSSLGYLLAAGLLGLPGAVLLVLSALAFSGYGPTTPEEAPGAVWFVIPAIAFGLCGASARCWERAWSSRASQDEPREPTPPEKPKVACPECGRNVWTESGLRQHRAAKHGV